MDEGRLQYMRIEVDGEDRWRRKRAGSGSREDNEVDKFFKGDIMSGDQISIGTKVYFP
jgi:hypothetical protein